jgi:hypothetical protein
MNIRLSPSGPQITNLNGSVLSLTGPGLQLRLDEASTPIGTHSSISTTPVDIASNPASGPPIIARLENPNAGYYYRGEVSVDIQNAASVTTRGEIAMHVSYDEGATWMPLTSTQFEVEEGGFRPTRAFLKMGQLAIPEGAPSIQVKGTMRCPEGAVHFSSMSGTGSAHIVLTELF